MNTCRKCNEFLKGLFVIGISIYGINAQAQTSDTSLSPSKSEMVIISKNEKYLKKEVHHFAVKWSKSLSVKVKKNSFIFDWEQTVNQASENGQYKAIGLVIYSDSCNDTAWTPIEFRYVVG